MRRASIRPTSLSLLPREACLRRCDRPAARLLLEYGLRLDGGRVYIHIIWFAAWIGFLVEPYPFGLLNMIVSLEAIFLSTFVMIRVNLADRKRQVLADHQWQTVQQEEQQNEELLLQPDRGAHQGHPRREHRLVGRFSESARR
jgi:hypothetical protein